MNYPSDFPKHLRPPVDGAFADAELNYKINANREHQIIAYVLKVWFAFANQACAAGEEGLWSGERIRDALIRYRDGLVDHVYFQKRGTAYSDTELRAIRAQVKQEIENSEGWRDIQSAIKKIAHRKTIAAQAPKLRALLTALDEQDALLIESKSTPGYEVSIPQWGAIKSIFDEIEKILPDLPLPFGFDVNPITLRSQIRAARGKLIIELTAIEGLGDTPASTAQPTSKRQNRSPNTSILKGKTLVNRQQAAEALGVTVRTIDRKVEAGEINPAGKSGRRLFRVEDLQKMLGVSETETKQDNRDKTRHT